MCWFPLPCVILPGALWGAVLTSPPVSGSAQWWNLCQIHTFLGKSAQKLLLYGNRSHLCIQILGSMGPGTVLHSSYEAGQKTMTLNPWCLERRWGLTCSRNYELPTEFPTTEQGEGLKLVWDCLRERESLSPKLFLWHMSENSLHVARRKPLCYCVSNDLLVSSLYFKQVMHICSHASTLQPFSCNSNSLSLGFTHLMY